MCCGVMLVLMPQVIADYSIPPAKELRRDLDATIRPYIRCYFDPCVPAGTSSVILIPTLVYKVLF